jgi:hypothetical protein
LREESFDLYRYLNINPQKVGILEGAIPATLAFGIWESDVKRWRAINRKEQSGDPNHPHLASILPLP